MKIDSVVGKFALAGVMAAAFAAEAGAVMREYKIQMRPEESRDTISRMVYGQFAEHLGSCVYEGIWVGEDSPIPNTKGYRNDALEALRQLHVPVLRWPGGCFADDYHWRDGIGDPSKRPTLINNNWGGTQEDNSFGTHEFFNLCEMLGIEPYLSVNIGSGTVQEAAQWIEYVTAPNGSMAAERAANGRNVPTLAATASRAYDGSVTITVTNPIIATSAKVEIPLSEGVGRNIELAEILTAPDPHARNTFERPDAVKTMPFKNAKVKGGKLIMELPGVSVASVRVK